MLPLHLFSPKSAPKIRGLPSHKRNTIETSDLLVARKLTFSGTGSASSMQATSKTLHAAPLDPKEHRL